MCIIDRYRVCVYLYIHTSFNTPASLCGDISKDPSVEVPSIMKPGPGNGAVAPGPAVGSRWKQKKTGTWMCIPGIKWFIT